MPELTCELDSIQNPQTCNDRGGIRKAYWFLPSQVDWETMIATPAQFDTTNHIILGYTMLGGAVFEEISFQPKTAFYDFTFTSDTDVYTLLVTWQWKAKDPARRLSLQKAIQCCDIGIHMYMNDGTQRVIGVDYNGETVVDLLEPLRITRQLDSSGQLGTSKARDEIDFGGETFFAPMFATVLEANLPLT